MGEEVLPAARALESETIHKIELGTLRDLRAIDIQSLLRSCADPLRKFALIPRPLVCNNITTTHTPDRNDHFGDRLLLTPQQSNLALVQKG